MKINYLQNLYLFEDGYNYYDLLWHPAWIAGLYLILGPIVSNAATLVWLLLDKSCTALRMKWLNGNVLISKEERTHMYNEFDTVRQEFQSTIDDLTEKNNALRKTVAMRKEHLEQALKSVTNEAEGNAAALSRHTPSIAGGADNSLNVAADYYPSKFKSLSLAFQLPSNKHGIEQWVSSYMGLNIDFPPQANEIEQYKAVISKLLENHTYKPAILKVGSGNLQETKVLDLLFKLQVKHLCVSSDNENFSISNSAFEELTNLLTNYSLSA